MSGWHFVREGCAILDEQNNVVARLSVGHGDDYLDESELRARGTVIAASRNLLAALEGTLAELIDADPKRKAAIEFARAAIAQAKGK